MLIFTKGSIAIDFNLEIDPASIGGTPVTITGITNGDRSSNIGTASLANGNKTLIIPIINGGLPNVDSHGDDRVFFHNHAFNDLRACANEAVIFDDGWVRLKRLKHATQTDPPER